MEKSKALSELPPRKSGKRAHVSSDSRPSGTRVKQGRIRLAPKERERMILDAAMEFFAERGFAADTRELARDLGVSQSLIYRYFGNKENLLERVYEQTFVARWKVEWEPLLKDRELSLEVRLRKFYLDYFAVVDDPVWIRIAMRSSLAGHSLTGRYIESLINRLLETIAEETRHAAVGSGKGMDRRDLELAWHLHSTLIYYLIRKYIHRVAVSDDVEGLVEVMVQNFLFGISPRRDASGEVDHASPEALKTTGAMC